MLTTHKNRYSVAQAGWGMLLTLAIFVLFASTAQAQVTIGGTLCVVYNMLQGTVGRGLATIAIATVGIGAMLGKVSWGMAILVGVGIAALFGADVLLFDVTGVAGC